MTEVWAHRGASGAYPENTLLAFEKAIEMGADGIELDVHMTRDGVVVVAHDEAVDRASDGTGRIIDQDFVGLRRLDFSRVKPGQAPQRIPTLGEVLELLRPTHLSLNIELKTGIVLYEGIEALTLKEVKAAGMGERTIYSSFNHYALKTVQAIDPVARIGLLYQEPLIDPWRYAAYAGASAIHPYYPTLQVPGLVAACRGAGIAVHPWTVDEPAHLAWMFQLGVDAVITNHPDRALHIRRGEMKA